MQPIPKIHPTYRTEIPSTGEKIKIRPYTNREEKLIAMASLSDDPVDRIDTALDIIQNCIVSGEFDVRKGSAVDIEFLTVFIRSKSVGEIIENVRVRDPDTGKDYIVDVSLEDIYVEPKPTRGPTKLVIDEKSNAGVTIVYPTFLDLFEFQREMALAGSTVESDLNQLDKESVLKVSYRLYAKMIRSVWIGDDVYLAEDLEEDGLVDWIADLSTTQFAVLETFLGNIPRAKLPIVYRDRTTGEEKRKILTGFESFFFSFSDTQP